MKRTVRANVSQRLLKEIPKFFCSFEQAIAEMFQNAYRAKASEVIITFDPKKHLLTMEDNGVGSNDPQIFLTAGGTGWDEAKVTEPAGLGFFSLLNPEYVTHVDVDSNPMGQFGDGWKMSLTPSALSGSEIPVVSSQMVSRGTRISLHLVPEKTKGLMGPPKDDDSKDASRLIEILRKARAYYPFSVFVRGVENKEIPRKSAADAWVTLDLACGKVLLFNEAWNGYPQNTPSAEIVWEWRHIPHVESLLTAMHKAAGDEFEKACVGIRFIWFVDPKCGVRPKLPDRDSLYENEAFASAAREIMKAVSQHVFAPFEAMKAQLPPIIPTEEILKHIAGIRLPKNILTHVDSPALMRLGYRITEKEDFAEGLIVYYESGHGLRVECDDIRAYALSAVYARNDSILRSLNLQGIPACAPHESLTEKNSPPEPRLVFHGLRYDPEVSPDVALCAGIDLVDPSGKRPPIALKYLVACGHRSEDLPEGWPRGTRSQHGAPHSVNPKIIYAGGGVEFLKEFADKIDFWGNLFLALVDERSGRDNESEEYCDISGDEATVLPDKILEDIRTQVVAAYLPYLKVRLGHYYKLLSVAKHIEDEKWSFLHPNLLGTESKKSQNKCVRRAEKTFLSLRSRFFQLSKFASTSAATLERKICKDLRCKNLNSEL